jgi:hypothetical protein
MLRILWILGLLGCCAQGAIPDVDVCEVFNNPGRYDGQTIRMKALFRMTLEDSRLSSVGCNWAMVMQYPSHLTHRDKRRLDHCVKLGVGDMRPTLKPIMLQVEGQVVCMFRSDAAATEKSFRNLEKIDFRIKKILSACSWVNVNGR